MIKKFSSPKMRNREFVFTPKIEYQLVAEQSEANQNSLTFPFWCRGGESNSRRLALPKNWTISSPRNCRGRALPHPSPKAMEGTPLRDSLYTFPDLASGLGSGLSRLRREFPRIHPVFISELLRSGPKIQASALPLSYLGNSKSISQRTFGGRAPIRTGDLSGVNGPLWPTELRAHFYLCPLGGNRTPICALEERRSVH